MDINLLNFAFDLELTDYVRVYVRFAQYNLLEFLCTDQCSVHYDRSDSSKDKTYYEY